MTLECELGELLHAAQFNSRQRRAVARRLGWDGGPPTTLADAGAWEGYSRERVRQLEEHLREHPWVSEVAVVGVPDEIWGERVLAVIVPIAPFLNLIAATPTSSTSIRSWPRVEVIAVTSETSPISQYNRSTLWIAWFM